MQMNSCLKIILLQIYALEDGNAISLWETIGKVSVLDAERYSYIDWSMYVCSVPALL